MKFRILILVIVMLGISACNDRTMNGLKIVTNYSGSDAIIIPNKNNKNVGDILVEESIVFHCIKGDKIIGYRIMPITFNENDPSDASFKTAYENNLGAFIVYTKTKEVKYLSQLSKEDVKIFCL